MNKRNWRNPYVTIQKKTTHPSAKQSKPQSKKAVPVAVKEVDESPDVDVVEPREERNVPERKTLFANFPALNILNNLDIRTSVTRIRSNIKGISSTIKQMEDTMDTIFGAMEMFEAFGNPAKASTKESVLDSRSSRTEAAESTDNLDDESPIQKNNSASNLLSNIDLGQLLGLLQSPLVQSLLNQSSNDETRKKEG
ncbi:hypothetical protein [Brevibacillus daliensis]|uniref:hypothetical protein n=1 Tax=Brevibacillus daliensis TaxID=2892995 RepID=UPI001E5D3A0F|nr:hypothetical protein [Brevibacillus daliensis]